MYVGLLCDVTSGAVPGAHMQQRLMLYIFGKPAVSEAHTVSSVAPVTLA